MSSNPIAPTAPRRLRALRAPAALVVAAVVALGACTAGGEDARPGTSTSTTAAPLRCPDGSVVPEAAPAVTPPALDVAPRGPAGRDGALDIATLLPRTGDLAFLGPSTLAGVELAVADLQAAGGVLGAPIGLRHGDSAEGSPGTAESEVADLLVAGADVVIGPLSSATAAAVLDQVVAADAVMVSPASTSNGLDALDRSGRLFRTGATESLQGRGLADLLLFDGHATVSLAARADEYGEAIADATAARLEEAGATVVARVDYDPSAPDLGEDVAERLDTSADALVLVGLAESALILDALVAAGEGPRDRPVYGTDGNLGERLGDLVADAEDLACLRGLLPVDEPDTTFADRIRDHSAVLARVPLGALDLAAESYDATVVAALATATAGSDRGAAVAGAMAESTTGTTPCGNPRSCLELVRAGANISYVGQSGRLALGDDGNRTEAGLTVVAFDAGGRLARLGSRRVRAPR